MRRLILTTLLFAGLLTIPKESTQAAEPIRVVIWDEQQPSQKQAYPEFLGDYIAAYLKRQPGLKVTSVSLSSKDKGLDPKTFDDCDVLIWWGHVRNRDVTPDEAMPIVERIKRGELSMIALHSAHWATPFVMAMHERAKIDAINGLPRSDRAKARVEFLGQIVRRAPKRDAGLSPKVVSIKKSADGTTVIRMTRPNCCFPGYRNDGKPSEVTTLLPDHPIAKDIPKKFTLAHTEMYDEPNHVPKPDAVIFREDWKLGEHFRSGAVWNIGKGKVFYFRPGHETHAVFMDPVPMTIVENAVRWLGEDIAKQKAARK
jgi:trehalose utilization protein